MIKKAWTFPVKIIIVIIIILIGFAVIYLIYSSGYKSAFDLFEKTLTQAK